MRTNKLKRERTSSLSPPLRPSSDGMADGDGISTSAPPTPSIFVGLIQCGSLNESGRGAGGAATRRIFLMRHNYMHMQTLQEVLRRTSLAEMRDREVVEWLLGTEKWLRDFHQPLELPVEHSTSAAGRAGAMNSGTSSLAQPSSSSSSSAVPLFAAPAVTATDGFSRAYSSALSELRLLLIGVLHTMPWWRVVETVANRRGDNVDKTAGDARGRADERGDAAYRPGGGGHSSSGGGGGHDSASAGAAARRSRSIAGTSSSSRHGGGGGAGTALDRYAAARQVLTRWHVRLQIAFERVCLVLIEKSQHTVRGVFEVLLKPCQLRPPVRDGARRSIPSDSFIRVLNAVATLYSSHYVMEVLESCITDFMPRQRWVERRHHVACTAVLLYVALEGQTPAFDPRLGNSQSLQRAVELLKSLRSRGGVDDGVGGSPWRLPPATRSSSLTLGIATSEDSGTDAGGGGSSSANSCRAHRQHHASSRELSAMLPGGAGVLPAGYVSATLLEDARGGGKGLRQPALLRPGGITANSSLMATTTASETEMSEDGVGSKCDTGGRVRQAVEDQVSESGEGGGGGGAALSNLPNASVPLSNLSVHHNNKLLAHRNSIVRLLLNRLLEVEQTLEPREGEDEVDGTSLFRGGGGNASMMSTAGGWASQSSLYSGGSPFGSAPPSTSASPSSLLPCSAAAASGEVVNGTLGGQSLLFPSTPSFAGAVNGIVTAPSSTLSSPAALSPTGISAQAALRHRTAARFFHRAPFGAGLARPLEDVFSDLSRPYLRILRDCTTLVYGSLADDLRRQQVAGSCGNADWWSEILHFYLTLATRVERPVYLLYLAPSLAMLGTADEPVNLLHKLITLVTKGSMPVEQPRSMTAASGCSVRSAAASAQQAVQPVRLRMAPPTGGSRRVISIEERLRAARHIFPLFRFLRSRLDDASREGLRRRLLKWTAQELHRLGGAGLVLSANTATTTIFAGGSSQLRSRPQQPSRETQLALVTFAQCAAMSELMNVDILPSPQADASGSAKCSSGSPFTASLASGGASDSTAAALQPLLTRYTLQTEQPDVESDKNASDGGEEEGAQEQGDQSAESSISSTSSVSLRQRTARAGGMSWRRETGARRLVEEGRAVPPPRRQLDLRQMEFEGLMQPLLMDHCPWQAWLH